MEDIKQISERLKLIASYIPKGAFFADIGSDHAYLPTYVCLHDQDARAIAGEVNLGPFKRAEEVVNSYLLADRIDVRLGDGLDVIKDEKVNCVTIAGMGGSLITSILERNKHLLEDVERLILQPNIDEKSVRSWLRDNEYILVNENLIYENGHYYEIIVADKVAKDLYDKDELEKELFFGPVLLKEKTIIFKEKWAIQADKIKWTINEMNKATEPNKEKIHMFTRQLNWIEEVLIDDDKNNE